MTENGRPGSIFTFFLLLLSTCFGAKKIDFIGSGSIILASRSLLTHGLASYIRVVFLAVHYVILVEG